MENGQAQPKQTSIMASNMSGFIDSPLFLLFCKAVKHYIEFLDDEIEKVFVDYMLVNLLNQASTEHIFLVLCAGYVFWSWVKVTENHHENRMHGIHFGSKHPLHQLLALFSSSRTRPVFSLTCQGANIAGSSYSLNLLYRQLPNALTNTHFPLSSKMKMTCRFRRIRVERGKVYLYKSSWRLKGWACCKIWLLHVASWLYISLPNPHRWF